MATRTFYRDELRKALAAAKEEPHRKGSFGVDYQAATKYVEAKLGAVLEKAEAVLKQLQEAEEAKMSGVSEVYQVLEQMNQTFALMGQRDVQVRQEIETSLQMLSEEHEKLSRERQQIKYLLGNVSEEIRRAYRERVAAENTIAEVKVAASEVEERIQRKLETMYDLLKKGGSSDV